MNERKRLEHQPYMQMLMMGILYSKKEILYLNYALKVSCIHSLCHFTVCHFKAKRTFLKERYSEQAWRHISELMTTGYWPAVVEEVLRSFPKVKVEIPNSPLQVKVPNLKALIMHEWLLSKGLYCRILYYSDLITNKYVRVVHCCSLSMWSPF